MRPTIRLQTGLWLLGALAGCAKQGQPATAPAPQAATTACGEDAPASPAHCACLGGYVRGDIGDGQVACPQGETELERVQQGIEGAVCCKSAVP